ncbi:MAG: hypothetical protein KKA73_25085 [Chloroflexi bacterium]|nr:hypothetical protein [Chloroflexota bacterium]MBU1750972.1 hypothetical protein [Chloroflexota bacterium]
MKKRPRTALFLVAGLFLLAGLIAPVALASEGVWGPELTNPSFLYRLGPETRLTPSPECDAYNQSWPAVAHNYAHNEYMVVWENTQLGGKNDIYARRMTDSGQLLSWFCVTTGANNRRRPALAYNATSDEYLVVWQHEVSSGVCEVWGRRIKWNGADLGLPQYAAFQIFAWSNRGFVAPRVAWNSIDDEYLVVWSAFDTGTLLNTDVACKRVKADGTMPYGHLIISNVGAPQEVDIVYNVALNGYLAVWARHDAATGYDIRGAFLNKTGAVITPPGKFDVYVGASGQTTPAVTTNEQNHYMVVWQHFDNSYVPGDWDIYGRLFQANGSPVTGPFMLSNTTDDEMMPDVAANGATQQYLAVWHRNAGSQSIVTARLRNTNGTLASVVAVLYAPGWNAVAPVVACDIPGFLIAYEKGSGWVPYHIYGRLYWPETLYLPLMLRNH